MIGGMTMTQNNTEVKYGIYNTIAKEFQFGISAKSKSEAMRMLFQKIGNDARKWRFEVREIPRKKKGEQ
jgi:hypothetical protein